MSTEIILLYKARRWFLYLAQLYLMISIITLAIIKIILKYQELESYDDDDDDDQELKS